MQDVLDFLAELEVADKLPAVMPRENLAQGKSPQRAELDPPCRLASLRSGKGGEAVDNVAVAVRLVNAQDVHPLRILKIKVGYSQGCAQFLEQREGALQQRRPILRGKRLAQPVVAGDGHEGGRQLLRFLL